MDSNYVSEGKTIMKKFVSFASVALLASSFAAPIVATAQDVATGVIITDTGGVDDKSFNQSAWEGLQKYGEDNGLEKGVKGYNYIQSTSDSDYVKNLNLAVSAKYDITFAIGYKLAEAVKEVAEKNPDSKFAIVDSVVEGDNVISIGFKDHEAAFLAGVAAAKTTKTNHVGFIGGVEGVVIDRFEAGFVEGVKAVNPDIKVDVQYAASFSDAAKGKQIAAAMFESGADIIYHASGAVGNGVFSEAKDIVTNDPSKEIYVIGVDMDQDAEGIVEIDGKERHLTLASTLKGVGASVEQVATEVKDGKFEAGVHVFGLADGGVDLTTEYLSDDAKAAVEEFKAKLIAGEIEVPETPAK